MSEITKDVVDEQFAQLCAATHGGSAEYDPFGPDEAVVIDRTDDADDEREVVESEYTPCRGFDAVERRDPRFESPEWTELGSSEDELMNPSTNSERRS